MKFAEIFSALVKSNGSQELAKLDAHQLADIGFNTSNARTNIIRTPAEAGVRTA